MPIDAAFATQNFFLPSLNASMPASRSLLAHLAVVARTLRRAERAADRVDIVREARPDDRLVRGVLETLQEELEPRVLALVVVEELGVVGIVGVRQVAARDLLEAQDAHERHRRRDERAVVQLQHELLAELVVRAAADR